MMHGQTKIKEILIPDATDIFFMWFQAFVTK